MVLGVIILVSSSVATLESDSVSDDINRYFVCQLGGYNPMCEDFRREFERHLHPGLLAVTYIFIGLISTMHILFVIQAEHVKKLIHRFRLCFHASA